MPYPFSPSNNLQISPARRATLLTTLAVLLCLCFSCQAAFAATRILFIGNSFTYAEGSPVRFFHPEAVHDLNNSGIGGVPALFKKLTERAGLDYDVSLETSGGKGLDWHFANAAAKIGQPWDVVVMHGYSTLDAAKPGDPALLVSSTRQVATLLHEKNPEVAIFLMSTWARADQLYTPKGHWYGKPIDAMTTDIRTGYNQAAAGCPFVRGVIPVGEAWNRAIQTGFADANPYDGIEANKVDLWTHDHYHGSTYGYYIEALTVFGTVTSLDPRSLGASERSAYELGLSSKQATAMQQVAYDQLIANGSKELRPFEPVVAKPKAP